MHPRADAIRREISDFLSSDDVYPLSLADQRDLEQKLRVELGLLLPASGDITEARAGELRDGLNLLRSIRGYFERTA